MRIQFSKDFEDAFTRLKRWEKDLVSETIQLFRENPFDPSLRNHALRANLTGARSLSVGDDLRIIFRERGNYIEVLMLDVGTHEDVY